MNLKIFVRQWTPRSLRNWFRMPSRSLSYIRDRASFALGHSNTVLIREGWEPKCHPAAREHFEVFKKDPIQSSELDAFIKNCPSNIKMLDVGAHYGFFALAALRYGGKGAQVVCVEASPGAASILRSTLALNKAEDQVSTLNVALGGEDGTLPMLTTGPLAGDYFVVPTEDRVDTVLVPQRSLQSILKETGFVPTHVKIDIEGFEYEVLDAAREVLRELRPILFLELHGDALHARKKDPQLIMQWLKEAGYSHFVLGEDELTDEAMAASGYNCRMICS